MPPKKGKERKIILIMQVKKKSFFDKCRHAVHRYIRRSTLGWCDKGTEVPRIEPSRGGKRLNPSANSKNGYPIKGNLLKQKKELVFMLEQKTHQFSHFLPSSPQKQLRLRVYVQLLQAHPSANSMPSTIYLQIAMINHTKWYVSN